jgi:tyrosine-protein kinase Etk/Wzc
MGNNNREFAVLDGGATNSPAPSTPPPNLPGREEESSLSTLLAILWDGRRLIAAALVLAAIGLVAYLVVATPIYESDVLIQIQERRPGSATEAFSDLPTALSGPQSQAETEIEVLQSRRILGNVVDSIGLEITALPRYFPIIGYAFARRYNGLGPAAAPWGLSGYSWGGDRISVARFDIPPERQSGVFTVVLVTDTDGRYSIRTEDGRQQNGTSRFREVGNPQLPCSFEN